MLRSALNFPMTLHFLEYGMPSPASSVEHTGPRLTDTVQLPHGVP